MENEQSTLVRGWRNGLLDCPIAHFLTGVFGLLQTQNASLLSTVFREPRLIHIVKTDGKTRNPREGMEKWAVGQGPPRRKNNGKRERKEKHGKSSETPYSSRPPRYPGIPNM